MTHIGSSQKENLIEANDATIGFPRPDYILAAYLKSGKIPHALLFTGVDGSGKAAAATHLARAANCREPRIPDDLSKNLRLSDIPCGNCNPCRKIGSNTHPDFIVLEPSGVFIRINQIRSLLSILALKPYEARFRFILVKQADALNPEAGNALLKILEEPPAHTIIILNASQPADLLPTVVSRCRHIRFAPVSHQQMAAALENKYQIPPETAGVIAQITSANPARAESMAASKTPYRWIHLRDWIIQAAYLDGNRPASPTAVLHLLAFAEQLSKNKDTLHPALALMKSWIRDIIVYGFHPQRIINKDLTRRIQYVSQHMTRASLLAQFAAVQKAQKDIAANANTRIALEVMTTKLAKIQNEKNSWHSI